VTVRSYDPRTGAVNGSVDETTGAALRLVLEAARQAAPVVAGVAPAVRREWLRAIAASLEVHREELVALAERETALGETRLDGEVIRTAGQLRFYGDVAAEGSYLRAMLDTATDTTPHLARVNEPLGPVAVFGAGNFPFAFGCLGNDTASAIAAGCPVVVKAHPAHPLLSARLVAVARAALEAAGAPGGTLGAVSGFDAGVELVTSPVVRAVAFTGSQSGGLALWRAANEREVVIPVFAEMGTVNPIIVTPGGAGRMAEIAAGFVASFTLGSGQFCTKPGLLLAPSGSRAAAAVAGALQQAAPRPLMLTEAVAAAVPVAVDALVAAGASVVATVPGPASGWTAPAVVLEAPVDALHHGSRLLEECFGAVVVVTEYGDTRQFESAVEQLHGALAGSVMTAGGPDVSDDADAAHAVRLLATKVGRVAVDDWPTGVAYTWAQQHGGPWPATSAPAATSVGAAALDRFVRPVTYQSAPDGWLPVPLRAANPWSVPRRIDGALAPDAIR
jgi:NADP-dependent aldehyde dehydrogenase